MPTYDYSCKSCKMKFEAFHSMNCDSPQFCPHCGKPGKRLLSAGSVIFKGSGFYTTDYRDSGYLEAKKSENGNNPPASTSKPDSTTPAKSDLKKEPASTPCTSNPPPSSDSGKVLSKAA